MNLVREVTINGKLIKFTQEIIERVEENGEIRTIRSVKFLEPIKIEQGEEMKLSWAEDINDS